MDHNHFICHFYCNFSMFSCLNLSGKTWCLRRTLMTSSDSVCKIMSCCFIQSVFDLVYHLYGICRMYTEENPQDFRLPTPRLYSWERVILFLSAKAAFKPSGSLPWEFTSKNLSQLLILCRPSLAYEGSGYPIFRAELSVALLAYMKSAVTHLTLTLISFYCIRIQFLRRIPSLNALNEMFSMKDIPSICILLTFGPNSTGFVSLPLTLGRI